MTKIIIKAYLRSKIFFITFLNLIIVLVTSSLSAYILRHISRPKFYTGQIQFDHTVQNHVTSEQCLKFS